LQIRTVGILPTADGEVTKILASIMACHRLIIAMVSKMPALRALRNRFSRGAHGGRRANQAQQDERYDPQ
jgi:hypothetical protein